MLSDSEIAYGAIPEKIDVIAGKLGFSSDEIENYGSYKAKLPLTEYKKRGKLILVTAMNPTPLGEGKTTVSIGLADAVSARLNKFAALALREPSLGPVFGIKGGACGGGYCQVIPMEDINLHFTGDFHAVTSANNLIAALIDNHIHQGNAAGIKEVIFNRCMDMNDRALREIEIGLGGDVNGKPRKDGFIITAASEIMAILCLAANLDDLKARLARIIIGYDKDGGEITAERIGGIDSAALLLKDALKPNLCQTLEHTPALIHGGPFANIALGCNSVIATKLALSRADYVITEAGFGAELGAEKFLDIKCRECGFAPSVIVLVVTARSIKYNGGSGVEGASKEDYKALEKGIANVVRHLKNLMGYGMKTVVAINRHLRDTDEEIQRIKSLIKAQGAACEVFTGFSDGSYGGVSLANAVISMADDEPRINYAYNLDDPIDIKIEKIAVNLYGASKVTYTEEGAAALKRLKKYDKYSKYPICMAKTQYSFSTDPSALGAPENFEFSVRDIEPRGGAGFLVVKTGKMLLMPGLPASPNTDRIKLTKDGKAVNLM